MINLLPTTVKDELHYAKRNSVLLRWAIAFAVFIGILGAITVAGNIYIQYSINKQASQTAEAEARLQEQKIDEVQKRISGISSNTKLAIQVLSQEILFSKLLTQLATAIPNGTVLQQFQIEEYGGALSLQAGAINIDAATQLQVNLNDPENKIFKQADIENIRCAEPEEDQEALTIYKCTALIKALFADKNQFTLIGEKR